MLQWSLKIEEEKNMTTSWIIYPQMMYPRTRKERKHNSWTILFIEFV